MSIHRHQNLHVGEMYLNTRHADEPLISIDIAIDHHSGSSPSAGFMVVQSLADAIVIRNRLSDLVKQWGDWAMLDGLGVAFREYRESLPKRAADFPQARISRDSVALEAIGLRFSSCQACGRVGTHGIHRHHIVGGAGRSHEPTNLIMLCSDGPDQGCHAEAHGGKLSLANVLWLKWSQDRESVNWRRLAILKREFLPMPEPPT